MEKRTAGPGSAQLQLPNHPMAEAINNALGHWEQLNIFRGSARGRRILSDIVRRPGLDFPCEARILSRGKNQ
jgi:hypothetical protein